MTIFPSLLPSHLIPEQIENYKVIFMSRAFSEKRFSSLVREYYAMISRWHWTRGRERLAFTSLGLPEISGCIYDEHGDGISDVILYQV